MVEQKFGRGIRPRLEPSNPSSALVPSPMGWAGIAARLWRSGSRQFEEMLRKRKMREGKFFLLAHICLYAAESCSPL